MQFILFCFLASLYLALDFVPPNEKTVYMLHINRLFGCNSLKKSENYSKRHTSMSKFENIQRIVKFSIATLITWILKGINKCILASNQYRIEDQLIWKLSKGKTRDLFHNGRCVAPKHKFYAFMQPIKNSIPARIRKNGVNPLDCG